jgi:glycosyltransferase involved in cell wall biosynthesis
MMTIGTGTGSLRVLFLSGLQIYPPLSGGHLRSFALASALERRGLDVFVYSLVGRKADYLAGRSSSVQVWPQGTREYVDREAFGFVAQFGSYALGLPPLWISAWLRAAAASPAEALLPAPLREGLAWCDAVVADFPFVHPVFRAPSARRRLRVLSTHNLEHQLWDGRRRWLRAAVRKVELEAAEACDVLVSCCAGDREFFEANARVRRSVVVPNGIDLRRFHGIGAERARTRQALGIDDDVRVFLFTASKYGPNREAFDDLVGFAKRNARLLVKQKLHILVVGSVTPLPLRLPGLTATGTVGAVEPYFAAADAALNPVTSGAGTNVKVCEFIAARLPILSTRFGARGFALEDGGTAFLFDEHGLAPVLSKVRRLFDEQPERLARMAEDAYAQNATSIDMDASAERLVEAMNDACAARVGTDAVGGMRLAAACARSEPA